MPSPTRKSSMISRAMTNYWDVRREFVPNGNTNLAKEQYSVATTLEPGEKRAKESEFCTSIDKLLVCFLV